MRFSGTEMKTLASVLLEGIDIDTSLNFYGSVVSLICIIMYTNSL